MAVSWAACQDPQESLGGPDSGIFTGALVATFSMVSVCSEYDVQTQRMGIVGDYSASSHEDVVEEIK